MIRFLPILILLLAGCATAKKAVAPKEPQRNVVATVKPELPPKARLLPLNARVVGGKEEFRFVIIDFTNSRRPALDEKLGVFRVGQKVGEIKVSGPFWQDTTVAADLLAGEAKYGDEVRAE
jgi:hypothetical protein